MRLHGVMRHVALTVVLTFVVPRVQAPHAHT